MRVIANFNKDDCVFFEMIPAPKCCCTRKATAKTGVCIITDEDGIQRHKICSTKMPYCNYQKKGA